MPPYLKIASTAVAFACLALVLIPASAWHHPATDVIYRGFDKNLTYVRVDGLGTQGSEVSESRDRLQLRADAGAFASVNLITTPIQTVQLATDVTVRQAPTTGSPFRIAVWSPWTRAGYVLEFSPAPGSAVVTHAIVRGDLGSTLLNGRSVRDKTLGVYVPGQSYQLRVNIDRQRSRILLTLDGKGFHAQDTVDSQVLPQLFSSIRLSVTASTSAATAPTEGELTRYVVTLPHSRFFAERIDDARALTAELILALLGLVILGVAVGASIRRSSLRIKVAVGAALRHTMFVSKNRAALVMTLLATLLYFAGNAALFHFGGHPFDMGNERLYSYVAGAYGPVHLYYLPNLTSLAQVWGGVPYSEAAFPYAPVMAYLFTGTGWIYGALIAGGSYQIDGLSLDYVIKAVNVCFGLADAALIYLILRPLTKGRAVSVVASLSFLFNPAVWFSMSVWGQTHVVSVFFALLAIWAAQKGWAFLAWLSLAAACLTRPQMLVFGLVIGVFLLRKFPLRQNILALSWATIAAFIALAPLTLATSPSLPVDVMVNDFRIQEAGGNDPSLTTVSQDAYSIWPFVTYFKYGISGLYRTFLPSAEPLLGPLSFQRAGLILTGISLIVVIFFLVGKRKPAIDGGAYLPTIALGIVAFLMFMTGLVATHFILALPFLILCRRWMGNVSYVLLVVVWTITTLVPMYGDMGNVIGSLDYPLLSPLHNGVTRFFVALYSSDRFITFATLANAWVLITVAVIAFRAQASPLPTSPKLS